MIRRNGREAPWHQTHYNRGPIATTVRALSAFGAHGIENRKTFWYAETGLVCIALMAPTMAQPPRAPDTEAQRAALKRLDFLVGKWSGEARVLRGPGDPLELAQTEEAQYKLDGLILIIEGIGKTKAEGKVALQALGIVSYDDGKETYSMRAFNDGRYLETELKLSEDGKEITWGFTLGEIKTRSALRINEKGEWTELTEIAMALNPLGCLWK
jgi:hypothetical protein